MARCELEVVLDEPERVFEPGDIVSGRVIVHVDEDVRCDGLEVQHGWRTHGRGNTERSVIGTMTVFEGKWTEPGQYEYAFECQQPPGPETYHGHYLNVDWFVSVTADIPWALDPDAEIDHLARYDGARADYDIGSAEAQEQAGQQEEAHAGCIIVAGAVMLFVSVFPVFAFLGEGEFGILVFAIVFPVIGLGLLWTGVARIAARRKLGDVKVVLEPDHVFPGEEVSCSVSVTPPETVDLNEISLVLTATEVVVRGSGTNSRTYREELHTQTRVVNLGDRRTLDARVEHAFDTMFAIPQEAPPSFDSGGDNKLEWVVETHVDIPAWPDWKARHVLVVAGEPPREQASDAAGGRDSERQDWW